MEVLRPVSLESLDFGKLLENFCCRATRSNVNVAAVGPFFPISLLVVVNMAFSSLAQWRKLLVKISCKSSFMLTGLSLLFPTGWPMVQTFQLKDDD